MILVSGVVLVVASVALLHLGRWYVSRPGVSGPNGRSFAGETFALVFTTLFSFGFVLAVGEAIVHFSALNAVKLLVAIAVAWLGSRWVARTSARLQARRPAAPSA